MKQTLVRLFLILFFVVNVFPVTAQATCNLAPRLAVGEQGIVLVTDGATNTGVIDPRAFLKLLKKLD